MATGTVEQQEQDLIHGYIKTIWKDDYPLDLNDIILEFFRGSTPGIFDIGPQQYLNKGKTCVKGRMMTRRFFVSSIPLNYEQNSKLVDIKCISQSSDRFTVIGIISNVGMEQCKKEENVKLGFMMGYKCYWNLSVRRIKYQYGNTKIISMNNGIANKWESNDILSIKLDYILFE